MSDQTDALTIRVRKVRNAVEQAAVVDLRGRVDASTAPAVRDTFGKLVDEETLHLLVIMSGVDYLDSSGLSSLISGYRRVRLRNGTLSLIAPSEAALHSLNLTMLDRVFPIYSGEAWALEAIPRVPR